MTEVTEQENEFSNKLSDDILGLRDSVEVADWNHAAEIATEISRDGAESGWPLVSKSPIFCSRPWKPASHTSPRM